MGLTTVQRYCAACEQYLPTTVKFGVVQPTMGPLHFLMPNLAVIWERMGTSALKLLKI